MLPYAGCELNYHLNPLPRFEKDHAFTAQKKFIDRDVRFKIMLQNKRKHTLILGCCKRNNVVEKIPQSRFNFIIKYTNINRCLGSKMVKCIWFRFNAS